MYNFTHVPPRVIRAILENTAMKCLVGGVRSYNTLWLDFFSLVFTFMVPLLCVCVVINHIVLLHVYEISKSVWKL